MFLSQGFINIIIKITSLVIYSYFPTNEHKYHLLEIYVNFLRNIK